MRIKLLLSTFLLCTAVSVFAGTACGTFTLTNNLDHALKIIKDPHEKSSCYVPAYIPAGATEEIEVRLEDAPGQVANFIAIDAVELNKAQHYFFDLEVDKQDRHIVHEEEISDHAAYDWSDNNKSLYFCNAGYYITHHHSCHNAA